MAKLVSKLYRPAELLAVIDVVEECLNILNVGQDTAKDLVIDLRKKGYKIVKVDDGR